MWMSWFCSCLTCIEFQSAKSVEQSGKQLSTWTMLLNETGGRVPSNCCTTNALFTDTAAILVMFGWDWEEKRLKCSCQHRRGGDWVLPISIGRNQSSSIICSGEHCCRKLGKVPAFHPHPNWSPGQAPVFTTSFLKGGENPCPPLGLILMAPGHMFLVLVPVCFIW